MMNKQRMVLTLCAALVVFLAACSAPPTAAPTQAPAAGEGIANPASENCITQGGQSLIQDSPQGQYGLCVFEDNLQCEEWAMMRGDCPVGGVKITGYVTQAAVFCAVSGGEYAVTGDSGGEKEQGTCTFKNGKSCDVWQYYQGECTP